MAVGLLVVPEVKPFKQRNLTLGLPHSFAIIVIWATAMIILYLEWWLSGAAFCVFFYLLGVAGTRMDPYWWEILLKLPSMPRILAP